MQLTRRCELDFPTSVRRRGNDYARQKRVIFQECSPSYARGTVLGTRAYPFEVDFTEIREQAVIVSCGCRFFEDYGPCKHLWAVMVELDRQGISDQLPGRGDLDVLTTDEVMDWQEDDWVGDARKAPPPAPWRNRLDGLARQTQSGSHSPSRLPGAGKPSQLWLAYQALNNVYSFDGIGVEFRVRDRLKSGAYGKLKSKALGLKDLPRFDEDDRGVLELLFGICNSHNPESSYHFSYSYHSESKKKAVRLSQWTLPELLPRLTAWGKFGLLSSDETEVQPFRLTTEPCGWMLVGKDTGEEIEIQPVLEMPASPDGSKLSTVSGRILPSGWIIEYPTRTIAPFPKASQAISWFQSLEKDGPLRIPQEDEKEALEALWQAPGLPKIRLPERLRLPETRGVFEALLTFSSESGQLIGRAQFRYDTRSFDADDPTTRWRTDEALIRRDLDGEQARLRQLAQLEPAVIVDSAVSIRVDPNAFSEVASALHADGWILEADRRQVRSSGSFSAGISSGIDWFEVSGSMTFDDLTVELPELLEAARRHSRFVTLDDGTVGLLPDQWLKQFAPVADLAVVNRHADQAQSALRFENRQALLIDTLLSDSAQSVDADEKFQGIRQRLRDFDRLEPRAAPETFQGRLRPYQSMGLAWMTWMSEVGLGGCLADDMGLGKTIQVLAFLEQRRLAGELDERWCLLVVPRSLLHNWFHESRRFTPELPVHIHHGIGRKKKLQELRAEGRPRVLVTTYGTLIRDIVYLTELDLDTAVLDEAQAIKNPKSRTAQTCQMIPARRRLALTGTPIENHLGELWSIFEFLNPGMLGRLPALSGLAGKNRLPPESLEVVARGMRPLILRRTKSEVLQDLPTKTEQTLVCELSTRERKRYQELLQHYRVLLSDKMQTLGFGRSKMHVLEALLRLRQAACHPGLAAPQLENESSSKLEVLIERLKEVTKEGHKALVFSQFTKLLAIVRRQVEKEGWSYEYLDGRTRKREQRVARFQEDSDCKLFLISLKAGGVGLNLTAADYVFILDPWWNPAVEAQAIDRAHRIGQTKPVFAYRLIAQGTVEEKILEMQESKRALADAIVSQNRGALADLTAEDLKMLLDM